MRKLLLIAGLLISVLAQAQRTRYIILDSLLGPPADTFRVPTQYRNLPFLAARHDSVYIWDKDAHYWKPVGGGGTSLTASTNINITGSTIKTTDSLLLVASGEPSYYFRHRISGLGFPVATIKPIASGQMAFDIMPFGTPGNYLENGISWLDVCDANVVGASSGAVGTARVGITGSAVQFGSRRFGGGTLKKVNFIMDTDSIITLNTDGTVDVNTADFAISKNTAGANIQWLLNPNTGNSSTIWIIGQDFAANKIGFIRYENEGQSGGSPYQQPNQIEFVSNIGATNGIVMGTLLSGSPTKFLAGSTERLRLVSDSILWKTPQRSTSATWLMVYDSTTKNMSYIRGSDISTTTNIYNSDGSLTGNRVLSGASKTLNFDSLASFWANTKTLSNQQGTIYFNESQSLIESRNNSTGRAAGLETASDGTIEFTSSLSGNIRSKIFIQPDSINLIYNTAPTSSSMTGHRPIIRNTSSGALNGFTGTFGFDYVDSAVFIPKAQTSVITGTKVFSAATTYFRPASDNQDNIDFLNAAGTLIGSFGTFPAAATYFAGFGSGSHTSTSYWFAYNNSQLLLNAPSDLYLRVNNTSIVSVFSNGINVGNGSTQSHTVLQTTSFATAYRAITALRTLDATDYCIEVTANTFNVTLPTAVGIAGREYVITNSGSGVTTVATTSSQTFVNVTATPTTLTLAQFNTVTVKSNGANWLRLTSL